MVDPTTKRPEPIAEIYPGAPLRAVAVEVGFAPLLDAFARFGAFQRRHASDYPRMHETVAGLPVAQPDGREFERPRCAVLLGDDRAVSVAPDQLAAITYQYDGGYARFVEWALPILLEGLRDLEVERIIRVAYRYENRIPLKPGEDLQRKLRVILPHGSGAAEIRHIHLRWDQAWEGGGTVEVSVDGLCPGLRSSTDLQLDVVAEQGIAVNRDALSDLVHEMHLRARDTFENIITDQFREQLRGGKL